MIPNIFSTLHFNPPPLPFRIPIGGYYSKLMEGTYLENHMQQLLGYRVIN